MVSLAVGPALDAIAAYRALYGSAGGWVRHRGVLVAHAGRPVNQSLVVEALESTLQLLGETIRESDVAGTVVLLRPVETFRHGVADVALSVTEYPGPVVRRGVVSVALKDPEWLEKLADGLNKLWTSRASARTMATAREAE